MRLFFDTTVLIEVDRKNEKIIRLLERMHHHEFFISVVTAGEFLVGVHARANPDLVSARELLSQFTIIPLTPDIADKGAEYIAKSYRAGKPVEFRDAMIGATVHTHEGDILYTMNEKDFIIIMGTSKIKNPLKEL